MHRILIVEDEPAIAFGLELDLRAEGYEVEVVQDGETAVRRGADRSYRLIVLDVMLPRLDGFEVCRQLRKGGVKTPILLLTAKGQETDKVLGLDLGADDYVTKPFSPMELRARVRALLRRGTQDEDLELYCFGDVEVNFARGEVKRGGGVVDLTPLEFELLRTFVSNRGRVLSRQRLLDLVWGEGKFISERVVDNYIVSLRKKLEPMPSEPKFLLNVRGQGYRFDG